MSSRYLRFPLLLLVGLGGCIRDEDPTGAQRAGSPLRPSDAGPQFHISVPRVSRSATQTQITLDFEGLGNQEVFQRIGNAQFPGWLGLVDMDANLLDPTRVPGTGNFANEPSPSTAIFWYYEGILRGDTSTNRNPSHRDILFDRPVYRVSLHYAACLNCRRPSRRTPGGTPSLTSVSFRAFDAASSQLDQMDGPGNFGLGTNTLTDPTGEFNRWDTLAVVSKNGSGAVVADNRISKVQITGYEEYIGVDNVVYTILNFAPFAIPTLPSLTSEGSAVVLSDTSSFDPVDASGLKHPNRDELKPNREWHFFDTATNSWVPAPATYSRSGTYQVRLTVEDLNGVKDDSVVSVTVNNVSPMVTMIPDVTLAPGSYQLERSGSFTDPGVETGWTGSVDYGDGTVQTLVVGPDKTFSLSHQYPRIPDTYTAKVTIRDPDGGEGVTKFKVTVANTPPAVSNISAVVLSEGDSLRVSPSVIDPDAQSWTVTVDYGDSSPVSTLTPNADRSFNLRHRYLDGGEYTLSITVSDGVASATRTAQVRADNVPPSATFGSPTTVPEGASFNLTLSNPTDPSPTDQSAGFAYAFDCGNGTLTPDPDGAVACTAGDNGSLAVRGRIRDKDAGARDYTGTVTVTNVTPVVATVPSGSASVNVPWQQVVTFTDPGSDTWTATVNYGDGTPVQTIPLTSRSFTLSHTFATAATRTVQVTVTDDDGGVSPISAFQVAVIQPNRAPVANAGGPAGGYAGLEGSAIAFNAGASSDPDGDALTYAWNFGDGGTGSGATPSHSYANNGTYTVTLTVTDPHGVTGTATTVVNVANVVPAIAPIATVTTTVGVPWTRNVVFTDPGADSWTATVDYGSGPVSLGSVASGFQIGTTYATTDSRTVTVRVSDGSGTGTQTVSVLVRPVVAAATIEIRPESVKLNGCSDTDTVDGDGCGMLTVFVSRSATFDPRTADPLSLRLGNGDGVNEVAVARDNLNRPMVQVTGNALIAKFRRSDLLNRGELPTTAGVYSLFLEGSPIGNSAVGFRGSDTVRIIP